MTCQTMNIISDTTGSDIRIARQKRTLLARWKQTAEVEEATKMLRTLRYEKVGLREMEVSVSKQEKAKKSGG